MWSRIHTCDLCRDRIRQVKWEGVLFVWHLAVKAWVMGVMAHSVSVAQVATI